MAAYFGGIEGGGSHSYMMILDKEGNVIGRSEGPSTNIWQSGMEEVCKRLNEMIESAKRNAEIDIATPLKSIGMCLSGCEKEDTNKQMTDKMLTNYPHASEAIVIKSDTIGSIATACENGGMVLISGTGSNCQLVNHDGSTDRCGGWGHMMGDEGSAYWIARRAIKYLFDHDDKLPSPFDPTFVRKQMYEYFKISDRFGLLPHLYSNFNKTFFAGFCKILAIKGANDPLCKYVFEEAGERLAQHVNALLPSVSKTMLTGDSGLQVVCVGSVWKSWPLFKEAFVSKLQEGGKVFLQRFTLVELTQSSAVGAAYIGVNHVGCSIPKDLTKNYKVLYQGMME